MAHYHSTPPSLDKIHFTQMSKVQKKELRATVCHLLSTHKLSFYPHAIRKMVERNIVATQVMNVLTAAFSIIEFKDVDNKHKEFRVLLRCHTPINNNNICIVLSLTTKDIVTVYVNDMEDRHNTIDLSQYCNLINPLSHLPKINYALNY